MKEKARITWILRQEGGKSRVQVKGSGAEILMGIKIIVTEVAEVLAKELCVSKTDTKEMILEVIKQGEAR